MKRIPIQFNGYWRLRDKYAIPDISGVYCVYENKYDAFSNRIEIIKLIYIGGSANVRDSIKNHPDYNKWLEEIDDNHELCFSVGYVDLEDCQRAKNALIFEHQPVLNGNGEEFQLFPFPDTTITLTRNSYLLRKRFAVCQVDSELLELDCTI